VLVTQRRDTTDPAVIALPMTIVDDAVGGWR
jgi:hypothetical protein